METGLPLIPQPHPLQVIALGPLDLPPTIALSHLLVQLSSLLMHLWVQVWVWPRLQLWVRTKQVVLYQIGPEQHLAQALRRLDLPLARSQLTHYGPRRHGVLSVVVVATVVKQTAWPKS
jgi:hypothetical protein